MAKNYDEPTINPEIAESALNALASAAQTVVEIEAQCPLILSGAKNSTPNPMSRMENLGAQAAAVLTKAPDSSELQAKAASQGFAVLEDETTSRPHRVLKARFLFGVANNIKTEGNN